jgi:hypothetical protein
MGTTKDQPGILHRAIAVVCLAVIVFLGVAGVSADLHGAVHAAQKAPAHEEGCAVALFAQSATQPFGPPQLAALPGVIDTAYARTAEPAVPTKPAGTHPPGRGPPLE